MALGMTEYVNTLKDFSFGFDIGEEEYSPENEQHYENLRWCQDNKTLLLKRIEHCYILAFSDSVTKAYRKLYDFDPLLFKIAALQLLEE